MYEISIKKTDIGGGTPTVTTPKHIVDIFLKEVPKETCQEHVIAYFLNKQKEVIAKYDAGIGGRAAAVIDPVLIARAAIGALAHSVIIVHNHPFGDPRPSRADIDETSRLRTALYTFGIALTDHVIVSDDAWFSFSEEVCRSLADGRIRGTGKSNVNTAQP